MILNFQDNELFKNYILSLLKKNTSINLLINTKICNNLDIDDFINIDNYINNIQTLLNYLIENNLFISKFKIKSNLDLFIDNKIFQIFDLISDYFSHYTNNNKIIIFENNYKFCSNINKLNEYINLFNNKNIKLLIPTYLSLKDNFNKINDIKKLNNEFYVIINPTDNINDYMKLQQYNINSNIIINKNIYWNDDQIQQCLFLIKYIIDNTYNLYNNKKDFVKNVIPMNNKYYNKSPIIISYFDKFANNTLHCDLSDSLSINCKDLSLPACCGLQHSIFCGGRFEINEEKNIIDIKANEGINGYLNQRITNSFFQPNCVICANKFFCNKGCHGFQWEYNAEPYITVTNSCKLENSILNLLIQTYHELGLFDILFQEYNLSKNQKIQLIDLLNNKGFNEYEYKYS